MKVIVLEGQSLLDIAIQELGDIEGLFDLAEKSGISITEKLHVGQELELPTQVYNKRVVEYYKTHSIKPATAIEMATEKELFKS